MNHLLSLIHIYISTVKKILINRIYTGDLVQHTQTKVSYISKKKITLDEILWIVVENTHEPLVDKDTFDYVNNLRKMCIRDREQALTSLNKIKERMKLEQDFILLHEG